MPLSGLKAKVLHAMLLAILAAGTTLDQGCDPSSGLCWRVVCSPIVPPSKPKPQCITYPVPINDRTETIRCPAGFSYSFAIKLCLPNVSSVQEHPRNVHNENHRHSQKHHEEQQQTRMHSGRPNLQSIMLCWPPNLFEHKRGKCVRKLPSSKKSTNGTEVGDRSQSSLHNKCSDGQVFLPVCSETGSASLPTNINGCCCNRTRCTTSHSSPLPEDVIPKDIN